MSHEIRSKGSISILWSYQMSDHTDIVKQKCSYTICSYIVPSRYFCGGSFCFMSWCIKNFLCCWRLMYVFIFLVKLR